VINGERMSDNIASTYPTKVKSQGRIIIPKMIREALCIQDGDQVIVTVRKPVEMKINV